MAYMEKILITWFKSYLGNTSAIIKFITRIKKTFYQLHVELLRVQYWDQFCLYFMLKTCQTPQNFSNQQCFR